MSKAHYKEMLGALEDEGLFVISATYSWRTFGSWSIVVDVEPERAIIWDGRKGQISIRHTPSGDWTAFSEYGLHWEGPDGYTPRVQAVIDVLLRKDSPAKRAHMVRVAEAKVQALKDAEKAEKLAIDVARRARQQERAYSKVQDVGPVDPDLSESERLAVDLLSKHMLSFNYDEHQLLKEKDFFGLAKKYERRNSKYLLWVSASAITFAVVFSTWGRMMTLFFTTPLFGCLLQFIEARKTRIAVQDCLAPRELAAAKVKRVRRQDEESSSETKQPIERKKPLENKRRIHNY